MCSWLPWIYWRNTIRKLREYIHVPNSRVIPCHQIARSITDLLKTLVLVWSAVHSHQTAIWDRRYSPCIHTATRHQSFHLIGRTHLRQSEFDLSYLIMLDSSYVRKRETIAQRVALIFDRDIGAMWKTPKTSLLPCRNNHLFPLFHQIQN